MSRKRFGLALVLLLAAGWQSSVVTAADVHQDFSQPATWSVPTAESVHQSAVTWLAERKVDPQVLTQVEALWTGVAATAPGTELLERLARTFALADPQAMALVEFCSRPRTEPSVPDFAWLADENTPALLRNNLRLLFGRWLAQEKLYDESLAQLTGLKPEDVVDPASLLFYQAIVHHRLLNKDAGLETIEQLLEREKEIPRRYASLARLMQADLTPLKDDGLDHISRRMDDIRRRLDLGRAGPKVREVEDGVIASLDKLIDEMEKQAQEAAAAAAKAGGRGNPNPSMPAPDSVPLQGKGPGDVAKKNIGNKSGWGDLPPKERQEALQQIGQDFPAHYRDMIEQYFRKLASEPEEK